MKFQKLEDIQVWQRSRELCHLVYQLFGVCKDYSFKDQLNRSSISVMSNIAEGYERKTNKDFSHFLFIAKGSAGEVRSLLYLAFDRKYIQERDFISLSEEYIVLSKRISSLIQTLSKELSS